MQLQKANTGRFFRKINKSMKGTNQVIGRGSMGSYPKSIAEFLQLQEVQEYTGHCFRRTAATLLADSGADIVDLQRAGGWASRTVAETYIAQSQVQQMKVASNVGGMTYSSSTSTSESTEKKVESQNAISTNSLSQPVTHVSNLNIDFGSGEVKHENTTINIFMPGLPGYSHVVNK